MPDERLDLERLPLPLDIMAKETGGLRPHYPSSYGYGPGPDNQKVHLRELWRTVSKRRWLILSISLIITTLVTIEVYRTKNSYQASTLIEIGKDASTLGRPGSIFGDDYDPFYMVNMKTKMLMVKSHSLLESVVLQKKLDQNKVFLGSPGKRSVWEALKTMGAKVGLTEQNSKEGLETDPKVITASTPDDESLRTKEEKEKIERCIGMLDAGLSVDPVKETRALRISFTHTDPDMAADLANAVAQDFLDRNFENKTEKYTNAARWLEQSTNKLKAQVQQSEEALARYTREHGIFSTDKEGTLTSKKLENLHDQMLRTSTERMLKQSLYDEVKQGRVEKLPEAYGDLLFKASPKIADLQKQLSDLETQAAELRVKYGPENPRLIEAKEKIEAIKGQIDDSRKSLEEKLKNEYERAVRDEGMLKVALGQAKGEAIQQNQDAIQFNILKQDVDTNKALYQDFLQKANQANAQRAEQQNNLRVIEPAQVPSFPVGPRRFFSIVLGLMLSTAAGVGLAFFLDYLDNTIKTVADVGRYAQLPALSVIPAAATSGSRRLKARGKRLISSGASNGSASAATQLASLDSRSSVAEAYRVLRTSVLLSAAGHAPKTILITSGQAGEGKTTTVVNTAISLSQMGASVLIVDCDLRRPTTHKVLGAEHHQGLSTYLSNESVNLDDVIQTLPIANLSLLPCGPIPPNPAELIISDRMKDLLRELAERYDHILVDSPPLINVTDPVILSTMVDGVILVVHGGKSTRDVVRRARQELVNVGAKIFGVVLNNVDLRREGYDYYYYNRHYSGYTQDGAEASHQKGLG
ncbi:MAG TPA: polysaccharide biosynthesis tyrosine autokinase [Blastocatellia bacterium]|nr:polysaccharide biosynthesis tyrosine autokinase [Blastocatellia bacterium]